MTVAPVEIDQPTGGEVVERDRPWVVIVWNDPINLMSYVTFVFQKLFGYTREKANRLMLQVHHEGRAVVSSGPRERAELDVFRLLMHGGLHEGRLAALDAFEEAIDADHLDEDRAWAWLRALNDIRLLLGTRLDVTEGEVIRRANPDDPRAASLALYGYLSWLEEQLVEALSD